MKSRQQQETWAAMLRANVVRLTGWEQSFLGSIERRLANQEDLSQRQHDKLAVISTRIELMPHRELARK